MRDSGAYHKAAALYYMSDICRVFDMLMPVRSYRQIYTTTYCIHDDYGFSITTVRGNSEPVLDSRRSRFTQMVDNEIIGATFNINSTPSLDPDPNKSIAEEWTRR